ncbi:hypothetical protein C2S53_017394 [Perilla frutescens var. hirtella]|uniref:Uncharacterized protein n=1 Tax=Perilla frutescens var. hirtella TaxID=608512 RepID=A0AAD4ITJ7_PERFH|nr:hypothetical protein C2S53_017394 [Perilla frutescens var. hirtella]
MASLVNLSLEGKLYGLKKEVATQDFLIEDADVSTSSVSVFDPAKARIKERKKRIKRQLEKGRKKKDNNAANST